MRTEFEVNRYVSEMAEIEDSIYEILESQWKTLPEISMELTQYGKLTLNSIGINGSQADELVKYFCLEYYKKYQKHYRKPNFREKYLDVLERHFPERKFQVAVAKHPHNSEVWRVRKRVFLRLHEQKGN